MKVYDDKAEKLISVKMEFTIDELGRIQSDMSALINGKSCHNILHSETLNLFNAITKILHNNR